MGIHEIQPQIRILHKYYKNITRDAWDMDIVAKCFLELPKIISMQKLLSGAAG